jgi:predicted transcriptional regulator
MAEKQDTISQPRRHVDELDQEVIACLNHDGEAPVSRIAQHVQQPYSTVLIRCLKLEAAGILQSEWYNHTRLFSVIPGERDEN